MKNICINGEIIEVTNEELEKLFDVKTDEE